MANQNFRVRNGLEVGTAVTISSSGNISVENLSVGNINAGIITATSFNGNFVGSGISATSLRVTGVSTFDGAVQVRNGYNLNIGDNNDLRIYNDGTDSRIEETGLGSLYISGSNISVQQHSTNKNFARFVGPVAELYYDNNKKFSTSGIGVTVTGTLDADQINLSGVVTATKFIKTGATASNFLKANGDDSALLSSDVTGALGYTPANSASVSGQYPIGNSIILDNFSSSFNGSDTDFNLASVGVAFTPTGSSANLVVSLGGVIQKPGTDFSIVQVGGANTNTIRFTTAPASGLDCFVVGLGGQGALLSDVSWNVKGDMVIATGDNVASMLSVGSNNSILIADSSAANGVKWGNTIGNIQITGVSTFTNGLVLVGSGTSTGTTSQPLQVTGGAYVSGNLGIGTTNPTEPGISVLGKVLIQQNSNSENRLIFRGQPGSSYRWNIDNYSSSNDFRIFREDDVTSANGSVAVSISTTGKLSDSKGDVRAIPQNSQTSAYILAASDIGKHISITTGGVTINTGIFSAGDAVSIYNNSGTSQTITQGTSVTLRQAGTANTGNRTLAQYGVCTVLCVGTNTFVISGAGLS